MFIGTSGIIAGENFYFMKIKSILLDIIFIVVLTVVLIILNEAGKMGSLMKFPFITIYAVYLLGRLGGALAAKRK